MTRSNSNGDRLIRLSEAAKSLPTRPNASTVWRWATRGCRGIRLETVRIGGFHYVSADALRAFLDATNEPNESPTLPKQPRSQKQRRASIRKAEQILSAAGI